MRRLLAIWAMCGLLGCGADSDGGGDAPAGEAGHAEGGEADAGEEGDPPCPEGTTPVEGACQTDEGGEEGAGDGGGEPRVCDPGETQACACPDATDGAQVCRDDRQGWSPCECAEAPTALACLPEDSRDCTCDNGRHGKQPCLADGSDWGGCACSDGPECEDSCQRGNVECVEGSGGYRLCRDNDDDGCVEWTPELPCPEGRSCFRGDCTLDAQVCDDDCSPADTQCLGNGVQGCEDIDDDDCLDWTPPFSCGDTERCEEGLCVDRQPGDECVEHEQCGAEFGICEAGECVEPYGRFWEVIVAQGHVAEPIGDLFDDPDPFVVITIGEEEFRTEAIPNTRDPQWFQAFEVFIRRGDPFRWRLSDSDLLGEERVAAWEFAQGVPISTLRQGSNLSFAEDGLSYVAMFFLPSDGPPPQE